LLVQVDGCYLGRLAQPLGLDGKPTGVATQIQHAPALTKLSELPAVVPLIAKETCLVPFRKVDAEPRAELRDRLEPRRFGRKRAFGQEALLTVDRRIDRDR